MKFKQKLSRMERQATLHSYTNTNMLIQKFTNKLLHYAHQLKPSRNAQQTLKIHNLQLLPTPPTPRNHN